MTSLFASVSVAGSLPLATPSIAGSMMPVICDAWSVIGNKTYDFYVRRYANTLTWTYGDNASTPAVRRQVADDLVDRLKDIARER